MMTTARPMEITTRRREALIQVDRDLVQYRVASADFIVEGVPIGGWDRRTYSDLHRAGYMTWTGEVGDRSVRLTKDGKKALRASAPEIDTAPADTP